MGVAMEAAVETEAMEATAGNDAGGAQLERIVNWEL